VTEFFVPDVNAGETEDVFAKLAERCHRPVLPISQRVRRITFVHDGEEWIAAVGEALRGQKIRVTRSKHGRRERRLTLSDPATVLAIFPGDPYLVVTDGGSGSRSYWANPFMAGIPTSVELFG
jgi:hypothetical protein